YNLATQTPQYRIQSLHDIENIPVSAPTATRPGILADVASISRASEMAVLSHYNIRRVVDIYGAVQDRDLGAVGRDIARVVDATANSILLVSFARERLGEHGDATTAAVEAGFTRFRPVLMTALAMIIGMVPMALGFGEGGEQNAPLGRAVIGGLLCATVAT